MADCANYWDGGRIRFAELWWELSEQRVSGNCMCPAHGQEPTNEPYAVSFFKLG